MIDEDTMQTIYTHLIGKRDIVAENLLRRAGIIDFLGKLIERYRIRKIQFETRIHVNRKETWKSFKEVAQYLLEGIHISVAVEDSQITNLCIVFNFDVFSSSLHYTVDRDKNMTESMAILNYDLLCRFRKKICRAIEKYLKNILHVWQTIDRLASEVVS